MEETCYIRTPGFFSNSMTEAISLERKHTLFVVVWLGRNTSIIKISRVNHVSALLTKGIWCIYKYSEWYSFVFFFKLKNKPLLVTLWNWWCPPRVGTLMLMGFVYLHIDTSYAPCPFQVQPVIVCWLTIKCREFHRLLFIADGTGRLFTLKECPYKGDGLFYLFFEV